MKYNTKSIKKLPKINNSEKWLIIDVRPKEEWLESHITNSINIPHHLFRLIYSKKLLKIKKSFLFQVQVIHILTYIVC
ncbi:rhodanese-like domain-containing protein [Spiroplasma poulsonii]|uniref:rhodanese-like domain-containing protein n=1 Tax=Spiroplasma poulsonii TaxID=2138 RepID=UPI00215A9E1A|nr:rhodanese-like domain-containing protein [Spiroplasma poulsonii]